MRVGENTATASFDPHELIFTALPHEVFPQTTMRHAGGLSLGVGYRGRIQPCLKGTNPAGVLKGGIKHHLVCPRWGQQLSLGEWPPNPVDSLRGEVCGCTLANNQQIPSSLPPLGFHYMPV